MKDVRIKFRDKFSNLGMKQYFVRFFQALFFHHYFVGCKPLMSLSVRFSIRHVSVVVRGLHHKIRQPLVGHLSQSVSLQG